MPVPDRSVCVLSSAGDGALGHDVWASMSDADMKAAWCRLRVELHAAVRDAESIAPLLETAGAGGVDAREFQVCVCACVAGKRGGRVEDKHGSWGVSSMVRG